MACLGGPVIVEDCLGCCKDCLGCCKRFRLLSCVTTKRVDMIGANVLRLSCVMSNLRKVDIEV